MTRALRPFVALVITTVGCTAPDYGSGHLQCAPAGACPSGFYCATDQRCWRTGSGPSGGDDLAAPLDLARLILDLGGVDLAGDPSKCAASNALLCEGFETPLLAGKWSQSVRSGSLTIDTMRSFRGQSSLRSSVQGGAPLTSPLATVSETRTFPLVGTLYVRVWVYFPSSPPPPSERFLNLDTGGTGVAVATDTGAVTLDDYAGNVYQKSATPMPLDRWACIQFDMSQGMPAGAIHITVEGKPLTDLPQTGATPSAVSLVLGLDFGANAPPIPAYDAWFDELIVDNKPITCGD